MSDNNPENNTVMEYRCITQNSTDPIIGLQQESQSSEGPLNGAPVVVGFGPFIPRWAPNQAPSNTTILLYFVRNETFPSLNHAGYASDVLRQAANIWNSVRFRVFILQTAVKEEAHFNLVYQANGPTTQNVLAEAFFPHQSGTKDLVLFELGMNATNHVTLLNTFLHELGHVLGLRHEFALATERDTAAVPFFQPNPNSVMAYTRLPTLQQSDADGIRAFYSSTLKPGYSIHGAPVVDYLPRLRNPPSFVAVRNNIFP